MSLFTPMTGVLGGTLIGSSAGVLVLLNGDIMGISGVLSNTLINPVQSLRNPKQRWRWVYMASFCMSVSIYVNYLSPDAALEDERSEASDVPIPSAIGHLVGGLLVGLGTKIGNGCTTGHGICGIGRFSRRSLVATSIFTGFSIATRFLISPLRSWASATAFLRTDKPPTVSPIASALVMATTCLAAMIQPIKKKEEEKEQEDTQADSNKTLGAALSGILFAAGLAISGMTKNSKIHDFLCFSGLTQETYDPTLMAVMASGIVSSWLSYQFIQGWSHTLKDAPVKCPLALPKGSKFGIPTYRFIDAKLLTGAVIFGVGWGLTGICPGPAMYASAAGVVDATVLWIPGFLLGSHSGKKILDMMSEKKEKKKVA